MHREEWTLEDKVELLERRVSRTPVNCASRLSVVLKEKR